MPERSPTQPKLESEQIADLPLCQPLEVPAEGRGLFDRLRNRWTTGLAIAATALAVAEGPSFDAQPAYAATTKIAEMGMPFGGKWGSTASGQANAHTAYSGNWAQDLFANGAEVKLNASAPNGGALSFNLISTWDSCGGAAGKGIKIGIKVDNEAVGWASYAHLDEMVTSGPIVNGMVLGKTKKWEPVEDCWEVATDAGVHTHFEARSDTGNYACYQNRPVTTSLSNGDPIARIGATNANGNQQACSTGDGNNNAPSPAKIDELAFIRTNHWSGRTEAVTWDGAPNYTTLKAASQTGYPAISDPEHVTPLAMDTNGDGIDELAFIRTNHWSGRTEAVIWDGAPHFTTLKAASQTGYPAITDPENVTPLAIDINGDNVDELAFIRTNHPSGRSEISLWYGAPNYNLHHSTNLTGYPAVADPENVTPLALDVNGDGRDELAFVRTNHGSGRAEISIWDGAPHYTTHLATTPSGYPAISDPENVTPLAIDINGDKVDELGFARSNHASGRTELSLWYGTPGFNLHHNTTLTGYPAVTDPANVTPLPIDLP